MWVSNFLMVTCIFHRRHKIPEEHLLEEVVPEVGNLGDSREEHSLLLPISQGQVLTRLIGEDMEHTKCREHIVFLVCLWEHIRLASPMLNLWAIINMIQLYTASPSGIHRRNAYHQQYFQPCFEELYVDIYWWAEPKVKWWWLNLVLGHSYQIIGSVVSARGYVEIHVFDFASVVALAEVFYCFSACHGGSHEFLHNTNNAAIF